MSEHSLGLTVLNQRLADLEQELNYQNRLKEKAERELEVIKARITKTTEDLEQLNKSRDLLL